MYAEGTPPVDPFGLYACVWTRVEHEPADRRIVPDACVDVFWHRESGSVTVAGPDTSGYVAALERGTLIGVRFRPGGAPAALGVPADALRDLRVSLDDLWRPARVRGLTDALAAARSDVDAERVLAAAVSTGVADHADPLAHRVITLLRSGAPVAAVADEVGLGERQLHRRSLAAFGYGPKVLHRILRFEGALRLARAGAPFAEVAVRSGYTDQAHLSREVKSLGGVPLGSLT